VVVSVAYTTAEGRAEILSELAQAVDQLGHALAYLGEAYDHVDEPTGDRLEEQLFRPVQGAYGRGRRTYTEFAARHGLDAPELQQPSAVLPSQNAQTLIGAAVEASERADHLIAELQDTLLPIEVGDQELRAGLTETRELIDHVSERARELTRTLGR
jgi:hypothetical protein